MNIDDNVIATVGGVIGAAVSWLGYRKVSRDNRVADAVAGADEAAQKAYEAVIERMVRETERMSKVNDALASKVSEAQLDNIQLRTEITLLREQVSKFRESETMLRIEIEALKAEIAALRVSNEGTR